MEQDGMASFVIGRDPLFLFGNDPAFLFCTNAYLYKGLTDIILDNIGTSGFCCRNGGFIHQVFQICACKSCRCLGNLIQIHIIP